MGSITIDEDLMDAANMIAGEKVQIVDNNNGERFETQSFFQRQSEFTTTTVQAAQQFSISEIGRAHV